jgi:hypothetical protein
MFPKLLEYPNVLPEDKQKILFSVCVQLHNNFPKIELRNMTVNKHRTIGDWIRQFEKEIESNREESMD